MTIDEKVIPWIISGFLALLALLTYLRNRKKDDKQDAGASAQVYSALEYIKEGVRDIQKEQRLMREDVGALSQRVSKLEGRLEDHINQH
jgi:predicted proteasome-type protease